MISAVVLTRANSTKRSDTLKSLEWADEIIVLLDSDKKIDLGKKVHVYTKKVNDDFAKQRNFGLAKARGDWVLFVDDDEVVSDELALQIQEATKNTDANGYKIHRIDTLWGKRLRYGETGGATFLRLAKKGTGTWQQRVHEVWHIEGNIGELQAPLLHYPHQTIASFLKLVNWYSTLYAKYLFEKGVIEPGWKTVVYPLGKFFVNFIVKQGYKDGTEGTIHAVMMSFHSFLVRAKLWHLWQKKI